MKKIGELQTYRSDEDEITIPVNSKLDQVSDEVAADALKQAVFTPNANGNLDILIEEK